MARKITSKPDRRRVVERQAEQPDPNWRAVPTKWQERRQRLHDLRCPHCKLGLDCPEHDRDDSPP